MLVSVHALWLSQLDVATLLHLNLVRIRTTHELTLLCHMLQVKLRSLLRYAFTVWSAMGANRPGSHLKLTTFNIIPVRISSTHTFTHLCLPTFCSLVLDSQMFDSLCSLQWNRMGSMHNQCKLSVSFCKLVVHHKSNDCIRHEDSPRASFNCSAFNIR